MIKLLNLHIESKNLVGLFWVLFQDEPVGHLIGINDNCWRFDLLLRGVELAPDLLQELNGEIFASFKDAERNLLDSE